MEQKFREITNPLVIKDYSVNSTPWNDLIESRDTFVINENPGTDFIRCPGFIISNEELFQKYLTDVFFKFNFESEFTIPRGNLSNPNYMFVGIKPGHPKSVEQIFGTDTTLLLGPLSKMLHRLLFSVNIYPYFTNVYKSYYNKQDGNINPIVNEIRFIVEQFPNIKIVVMGNYDEYFELSKQLNIDNPIIKIWHPSYIVRKYSDVTFNTWKRQLTYEIFKLNA